MTKKSTTSSDEKCRCIVCRLFDSPLTWLLQLAFSATGMIVVSRSVRDAGPGDFGFVMLALFIVCCGAIAIFFQVLFLMETFDDDKENPHE